MTSTRLQRICLLLIFTTSLLCGCQSNLPETSVVPSPAAPPIVSPAILPSPTASPAPTIPSMPPQEAPSADANTATPLNMRFGTTSPRVTDLQQRLMSLGYLAEAAPTQYYDRQTEAAVLLFQNSTGLEPTGMIDATTWDMLFSDTAPTLALAEAAMPSPETLPPATDTPAASLPLSGVLIGLDPGHQANGNSDQEPVAPGSSQTKAKVTTGTQGLSSRTPEYAVNLQVALKLKSMLEDAGAEVILSRESNDVDISNIQRAQMMNDAGVDLSVRLHCNGNENTGAGGAFILIPAGEYTTAIAERSREAAEIILDSFISETGAQSLGLSERSDQTGFNWSTVPVINIEMGHLTNPEEEQKLISDDYQALCAQGIYSGILRIFGA